MARRDKKESSSTKSSSRKHPSTTSSRSSKPKKTIPAAPAQKKRAEKLTELLQNWMLPPVSPLGQGIVWLIAKGLKNSPFEPGRDDEDITDVEDTQVAPEDTEAEALTSLEENYGGVPKEAGSLESLFGDLLADAGVKPKEVEPPAPSGGYVGTPPPSAQPQETVPSPQPSGTEEPGATSPPQAVPLPTPPSGTETAPQPEETVQKPKRRRKKEVLAEPTLLQEFLEDTFQPAQEKTEAPAAEPVAETTQETLPQKPAREEAGAGREAVKTDLFFLPTSLREDPGVQEGVEDVKKVFFNELSPHDYGVLAKKSPIKPNVNRLLDEQYGFLAPTAPAQNLLYLLRFFPNKAQIESTDTPEKIIEKLQQSGLQEPSQALQQYLQEFEESATLRNNFHQSAANILMIPRLLAFLRDWFRSHEDKEQISDEQKTALRGLLEKVVSLLAVSRTAQNRARELFEDPQLQPLRRQLEMLAAQVLDGVDPEEAVKRAFETFGAVNLFYSSAGNSQRSLKNAIEPLLDQLGAVIDGKKVDWANLREFYPFGNAVARFDPLSRFRQALDESADILQEWFPGAEEKAEQAVDSMAPDAETTPEETVPEAEIQEEAPKAPRQAREKLPSQKTPFVLTNNENLESLWQRLPGNSLSKEATQIFSTLYSKPVVSNLRKLIRDFSTRIQEVAPNAADVPELSGAKSYLYQAANAGAVYLTSLSHWVEPYFSGEKKLGTEEEQFLRRLFTNLFGAEVPETPEEMLEEVTYTAAEFVPRLNYELETQLQSLPSEDYIQRTGVGPLQQRVSNLLRTVQKQLGLLQILDYSMRNLPELAKSRNSLLGPETLQPIGTAFQTLERAEGFGKNRLSELYGLYFGNRPDVLNLQETINDPGRSLEEKEAAVENLRQIFRDYLNLVEDYFAGEGVKIDARRLTFEDVGENVQKFDTAVTQWAESALTNGADFENQKRALQHILFLHPLQVMNNLFTAYDNAVLSNSLFYEQGGRLGGEEGIRLFPRVLFPRLQSNVERLKFLRQAFPQVASLYREAAEGIREGTQQWVRQLQRGGTGEETAPPPAPDTALRHRMEELPKRWEEEKAEFPAGLGQVVERGLQVLPSSYEQFRQGLEAAARPEDTAYIFERVFNNPADPSTFGYYAVMNEGTLEAAQALEESYRRVTNALEHALTWLQGFSAEGEEPLSAEALAQKLANPEQIGRFNDHVGPLLDTMRRLIRSYHRYEELAKERLGDTEENVLLQQLRKGLAILNPIYQKMAESVTPKALLEILLHPNLKTALTVQAEKFQKQAQASSELANRYFHPVIQSAVEAVARTNEKFLARDLATREGLYGFWGQSITSAENLYRQLIQRKKDAPTLAVTRRDREGKVFREEIHPPSHEVVDEALELVGAYKYDLEHLQEGRQGLDAANSFLHGVRQLFGRVAGMESVLNRIIRRWGDRPPSPSEGKRFLKAVRAQVLDIEGAQPFYEGMRLMVESPLWQQLLRADTPEAFQEGFAFLLKERERLQSLRSQSLLPMQLQASAYQSYFASQPGARFLQAMPEKEVGVSPKEKERADALVETAMLPEESVPAIDERTETLSQSFFKTLARRINPLGGKRLPEEIRGLGRMLQALLPKEQAEALDIEKQYRLETALPLQAFSGEEGERETAPGQRVLRLIKQQEQQLARLLRRQVFRLREIAQLQEKEQKQEDPEKRRALRSMIDEKLIEFRRDIEGIGQSYAQYENAAFISNKISQMYRSAGEVLLGLVEYRPGGEEEAEGVPSHLRVEATTLQGPGGETAARLNPYQAMKRFSQSLAALEAEGKSLIEQLEAQIARSPHVGLSGLMATRNERNQRRYLRRQLEYAQEVYDSLRDVFKEVAEVRPFELQTHGGPVTLGLEYLGRYGKYPFERELVWFPSGMEKEEKEKLLQTLQSLPPDERLRRMKEIYTELLSESLSEDANKEEALRPIAEATTLESASAAFARALEQARGLEQAPLRGAVIGGEEIPRIMDAFLLPKEAMNAAKGVPWQEIFEKEGQEGVRRKLVGLYQALLKKYGADEEDLKEFEQEASKNDYLFSLTDTFLAHLYNLGYDPEKRPAALVPPLPYFEARLGKDVRSGEVQREMAETAAQRLRPLLEHIGSPEQAVARLQQALAEPLERLFQTFLPKKYWAPVEKWNRSPEALQFYLRRLRQRIEDRAAKMEQETYARPLLQFLDEAEPLAQALSGIRWALRFAQRELQNYERIKEEKQVDPENLEPVAEAYTQVQEHVHHLFSELERLLKSSHERPELIDKNQLEGSLLPPIPEGPQNVGLPWYYFFLQPPQFDPEQLLPETERVSPEQFPPDSTGPEIVRNFYRTLEKEYVSPHYEDRSPLAKKVQKSFLEKYRNGLVQAPELIGEFARNLAKSLPKEIGSIYGEYPKINAFFQNAQKKLSSDQFFNVFGFRPEKVAPDDLAAAALDYWIMVNANPQVLAERLLPNAKNYGGEKQVKKVLSFIESYRPIFAAFKQFSPLNDRGYPLSLEEQKERLGELLDKENVPSELQAVIKEQADPLFEGLNRRYIRELAGEIGLVTKEEEKQGISTKDVVPRFVAYVTNLDKLTDSIKKRIHSFIEEIPDPSEREKAKEELERWGINRFVYYHPHLFVEVSEVEGPQVEEGLRKRLVEEFLGGPAAEKEGLGEWEQSLLSEEPDVLRWRRSMKVPLLGGDKDKVLLVQLARSGREQNFRFLKDYYFTVISNYLKRIPALKEDEEARKALVKELAVQFLKDAKSAWVKAFRGERAEEAEREAEPAQPEGEENIPPLTNDTPLADMPPQFFTLLTRRLAERLREFRREQARKGGHAREIPLEKISLDAGQSERSDFTEEDFRRVLNLNLSRDVFPNAMVAYLEQKARQGAEGHYRRPSVLDEVLGPNAGFNPMMLSQPQWRQLREALQNDYEKLPPQEQLRVRQIEEQLKEEMEEKDKQYRAILLSPEASLPEKRYAFHELLKVHNYRTANPEDEEDVAFYRWLLRHGEKRRPYEKKAAELLSRAFDSALSAQVYEFLSHQLGTQWLPRILTESLTRVARRRRAGEEAPRNLTQALESLQGRIEQVKELLPSPEALTKEGREAVQVQRVAASAFQMMFRWLQSGVRVLHQMLRQAEETSDPEERDKRIREIETNVQMLQSVAQQTAEQLRAGGDILGRVTQLVENPAIQAHVPGARAEIRQNAEEDVAATLLRTGIEPLIHLTSGGGVWARTQVNPDVRGRLIRALDEIHRVQSQIEARRSARGTYDRSYYQRMGKLEPAEAYSIGQLAIEERKLPRIVPKVALNNALLPLYRRFYELSGIRSFFASNKQVELPQVLQQTRMAPLKAESRRISYLALDLSKPLLSLRNETTATRAANAVASETRARGGDPVSQNQVLYPAVFGPVTELKDLIEDLHQVYLKEDIPTELYKEAFANKIIRRFNALLQGFRPSTDDKTANPFQSAENETKENIAAPVLAYRNKLTQLRDVILNRLLPEQGLSLERGEGGLPVLVYTSTERVEAFKNTLAEVNKDQTELDPDTLLKEYEDSIIHLLSLIDEERRKCDSAIEQADIDEPSKVYGYSLAEMARRYRLRKEHTQLDADQDPVLQSLRDQMVDEARRRGMLYLIPEELRVGIQEEEEKETEKEESEVSADFESISSAVERIGQILRPQKFQNEIPDAVNLAFYKLFGVTYDDYLTGENLLNASRLLNELAHSDEPNPQQAAAVLEGVNNLLTLLQIHSFQFSKKTEEEEKPGGATKKEEKYVFRPGKPISEKLFKKIFGQGFVFGREQVEGRGKEEEEREKRREEKERFRCLVSSFFFNMAHRSLPTNENQTFYQQLREQIGHAITSIREHGGENWTQLPEVRQAARLVLVSAFRFLRPDLFTDIREYQYQGALHPEALLYYLAQPKVAEKVLYGRSAAEPKPYFALSHEEYNEAALEALRQKLAELTNGQLIGSKFHGAAGEDAEKIVEVEVEADPSLFLQGPNSPYAVATPEMIQQGLLLEVFPAHDRDNAVIVPYEEAQRKASQEEVSEVLTKEPPRRLAVRTPITQQRKVRTGKEAEPQEDEENEVLDIESAPLRSRQAYHLLLKTPEGVNQLRLAWSQVDSKEVKEQVSRLLDEKGQFNKTFFLGKPLATWSVLQELFEEYRLDPYSQPFYPVVTYEDGRDAENNFIITDIIPAEQLRRKNLSEESVYGLARIDGVVAAFRSIEDIKPASGTFYDTLRQTYRYPLPERKIEILQNLAGEAPIYQRLRKMYEEMKHSEHINLVQFFMLYAPSLEAGGMQLDVPPVKTAKDFLAQIVRRPALPLIRWTGGRESVRTLLPTKDGLHDYSVARIRLRDRAGVEKEALAFVEPRDVRFMEQTPQQEVRLLYRSIGDIEPGVDSRLRDIYNNLLVQNDGVVSLDAFAAAIMEDPHFALYIRDKQDYPADILPVINERGEVVDIGYRKDNRDLYGISLSVRVPDPERPGQEIEVPLGALTSRQGLFALQSRIRREGERSPIRIQENRTITPLQSGTEAYRGDLEAELRYMNPRLEPVRERMTLPEYYSNIYPKTAAGWLERFSEFPIEFRDLPEPVKQNFSKLYESLLSSKLSNMANRPMYNRQGRERSVLSQLLGWVSKQENFIRLVAENIRQYSPLESAAEVAALLVGKLNSKTLRELPLSSLFMFYEELQNHRQALQKAVSQAKKQEEDPLTIAEYKDAIKNISDLAQELGSQLNVVLGALLFDGMPASLMLAGGVNDAGSYSNPRRNLYAQFVKLVQNQQIRNLLNSASIPFGKDEKGNVIKKSFREIYETYQPRCYRLYTLDETSTQDRPSLKQEALYLIPRVKAVLEYVASKSSGSQNLFRQRLEEINAIEADIEAYLSVPQQDAANRFLMKNRRYLGFLLSNALDMAYDGLLRMGRYDNGFLPVVQLRAPVRQALIAESAGVGQAPYEVAGVLSTGDFAEVRKKYPLVELTWPVVRSSFTESHRKMVQNYVNLYERVVRTLMRQPEVWFEKWAGDPKKQSALLSLLTHRRAYFRPENVAAIELLFDDLGLKSAKQPEPLSVEIWRKSVQNLQQARHGNQSLWDLMHSEDNGWGWSEAVRSLYAVPINYLPETQEERAALMRFLSQPSTVYPRVIFHRIETKTGFSKSVRIDFSDPSWARLRYRFYGRCIRKSLQRFDILGVEESRGTSTFRAIDKSMRLYGMIVRS